MSNPITKEDLEKTKLNLEIGELKKPFYRKIAVMGPTLFALGSLGLGFYTGLFDIKNESLKNQGVLLELRRNELKADVANLQADRAKVAGQLEAEQRKSKAEIERVKAEAAEQIQVERQEFAEASKRLTTDIAALQADREKVANQLANEQSRSKAEIDRIKLQAAEDIAKEQQRFQTASKQLSDDFNREKDKLAADLRTSHDQLSSVRDEITIKSRELAELRTQYENSQVLTLIEQLASDPALTPFNQAISTLIQVIQMNKEKAAPLAARLEMEKNPGLRAHLIYVLYQGTADRVWLKRLFDFADKKDNGEVNSLWDVFGLGNWSGDDELAVMKYILTRVKDLKNEQLGYAVQKFFLPKNRPVKSRNLFSIQERAELLQLGRSLALDLQIDAVPRVNGIHVMAFVAPEAFPIIAAVILTRDDETERTKNWLRGRINDIRSLAHTDIYLPFKAAFDELEFPNEVSTAMMKAWLKTKKIKSWNERIMGAKLSELAK